MVKPYYIKGVYRVKINFCSQMFYKIVGNKVCKIYRKTPVLESLFNNVACLKGLHHKCFPMIL